MKVDHSIDEIFSKSPKFYILFKNFYCRYSDGFLLLLCSGEEVSVIYFYRLRNRQILILINGQEKLMDV